MSCISRTKFSRIDSSLFHRCGDHYNTTTQSCPSSCSSKSFLAFHVIFCSSISTVRCIFDCESICTDICGYNSICNGDLDTPSSVKCECEEGFWSPTADNKSCRRTLSPLSDLTGMTHITCTFSRGSIRATAIVLVDHPTECHSIAGQQQQRCACLHRHHLQRNNIRDDAVQWFVWYRS